MAFYKVTLNENASYTFTIEADSEDHASEIAEEMFCQQPNFDGMACTVHERELENVEPTDEPPPVPKPDPAAERDRLRAALEALTGTTNGRCESCGCAIATEGYCGCSPESDPVQYERICAGRRALANTTPAPVETIKQECPSCKISLVRVSGEIHCPSCGASQEDIAGIVGFDDEVEEIQEPTPVESVNKELLDALKRVANSGEFGCFVDAAWDQVNEAIANAEKAKPPTPAPIFITVEGGNVQNVFGIPAGMSVAIMDYDNGEAAEWDDPDVFEDRDGEKFSLAIYDGEGAGLTNAQALEHLTKE